MSKLFVVFCKQFTRPPKVLKTKSYVRSLVKKNPRLDFKEFTCYDDAQLFIKGLNDCPKSKEQTIIDEPYPARLDTIQMESKSLQSKLDPQEPLDDPQSPTSSFASFDSTGMGRPTAPILRQGIMKYFTPGKPFVPPLQPLQIKPTIHQNQRSGMCQVSYHIGGQTLPQNSAVVGQKHRHQGQLYSLLYALTDLSLNQVKRIVVLFPYNYTYSLFKSGQSYDPKLQAMLSRLGTVSSTFEEITFRECPFGPLTPRNYNSSMLKFL